MFVGSEVVNLLEPPVDATATSGESARTAHQSDLLASSMQYLLFWMAWNVGPASRIRLAPLLLTTFEQADRIYKGEKRFLPPNQIGIHNGLDA
jgi:hypothetical protein